MDFNYQEVGKWIAIGLFILALMAFIVPGAHAEVIERIAQGGDVYINGTYDIAGTTGWAPFLAYYGEYEDRLSPDNASLIYKIPLPSYKQQTIYYIDPATFADKPGFWYQYYADADEDRGNLRAFRVLSKYYTSTVLMENGTYNTSIVYNPANVSPLINPPKPILPEKHITDYLLARGDPLHIDTPATSRSWIFGRVDGIYGKQSDGNRTTFTIDELENTEPGDFTLLTQTPGSNTIYDATYMDDVLIPGLYGKKAVDVHGLQPRIVQERLIAMLTGTDDRYYLSHLQIQEPTITIESIDEVYHVNATVLDVRGYTNVANGTMLSFVVDEDRQTVRTERFNTFTTIAQGMNPGNMRYYQVFIPIDFENLPPGQHTLTGRTPIGSIVTAPWYVYNLPEGQVRPNNTIKYISGRYGTEEFVPTPTPVIEKVIEIQKEKVIETVTVPVTPSNDQVYEQQKSAIMDLGWFIISWIVWIVVIFALAAYVLFVRARVRE